MKTQDDDLVIISDFDSRLKWGLTLANYLDDCFNITLYYREKTVDQFENYVKNFYSIIQYSCLEQIVTYNNLKKFRVIVLALGGTLNIKFLFYFKDIFLNKERPIVISGMNGITDCNDLHALLCRVGSDIICVNSWKNYKIFIEHMNSLNIDTGNLYMLGYARKFIMTNNKNFISNQIVNVLFIEQPNTPKQKKQRKYLVDKIYRYAIKYPKRTIYIKCRKIDHWDHTNILFYKYNFYRLFKKNVKNIPKNIIFCNEPIEYLYNRVDLCLSFYSTCILESLHLGIKTVVLSDFGIGCTFKNHNFIGSGIFATLDDWLEDKIPTPEQKWLNENCNFITEQSIIGLKKIIFKKLNQKKKDIQLYYNQEKFPYFYVKSNYSINFIVFYLKKIIKQLKLWFYS
ncbi:DUF6716 putative glycosyltransferase [Campylobacter jejuni]|uniref:DUF6716 putative glycosyltransferase n=1 Tax=Campylobacter jejuni TaxID=197 RepID=UPI000F7FB005|nr:DUF6716 putative glycosyltransferase [Campylobacter jejuni]RTK09320.1 hypothetical protein C3H38_03505 [Campylobacter jejuni]HEF7931710.1 hypothetical protein [Campylobacter jejuni]